MALFGIRAQYVLVHTDSGSSVKIKYLRNHTVLIDGSKISAIAPNSEIPDSAAAQWWKLDHHILMPGLINGHTHLPMTLFRGLADDHPLEEWLHKVIFPLEGKFITPEFVQLGTELAALECIQFGTTTVHDMYFYSSTIAKTWESAGLRGMFGQTYLDFPTPDTMLGTITRDDSFDEILKLQKNSQLIRASITPHAPYTCSDETLMMTLEKARKNKIPLLIHVSESQHEVHESLKKYNETPVERLHRLGLTGKDCIYAHGVHLSDRDIEILKRTDTRIIYNPDSNLKLASGAAPIVRLLKNGITVGLGTDGSASNNDLSLFQEMDSGAKLQKITTGISNSIAAEDMLMMTTLNGAKAIGWDDQIGRIEVGKSADLIAIDLHHPHLQPVHDLLSMLVYATKGSEVSHVICNGKVLYENKVFKTLNPKLIYERAEKVAEKIHEFCEVTKTC